MAVFSTGVNKTTSIFLNGSIVPNTTSTPISIDRQIGSTDTLIGRSTLGSLLYSWRFWPFSCLLIYYLRCFWCCRGIIGRSV